MRLTTAQAAEALDTTTDMIYRWIESGDLPAYRVEDQFRINRTELLEWATVRNITVGPAMFQSEEDESVPTLAEALERGGGRKRIAGSTRADVLHPLVARLDLTGDEKSMLLNFLVARDRRAFVTLPEGVAIPHVRHPIILSAVPRLYAFQLADEIEFSDVSVWLLFILLAPTVRIHLHLIAELTYLLRQCGIRDALAARDANVVKMLAPNLP